MGDPQGFAPLGWRPTFKQWHERPAVHLPCWRCTGPGGKGRGEIGVARELVDGLTGRDPGSADHQRHPQILVVGRFLAAGQPMLAEVVSVVGGEDEVRIVELTYALDFLVDRKDRLVDRLE